MVYGGISDIQWNLNLNVYLHLGHSIPQHIHPHAIATFGQLMRQLLHTQRIR
jgi:hypothetical protein